MTHITISNKTTIDMLAALELAEMSLRLLATEQARYNYRRPDSLPHPTNHIDALDKVRAAIAKAKSESVS